MKANQFENNLEVHQAERESQEFNCLSDSDKIENILNKLSEYCDSNLDINEQGAFTDGPPHLRNHKSKFSGGSGGSKEISMRSLLINQSTLHNLSGISHNTRDSTRGEGSQPDSKTKKGLFQNDRHLNSSESKAVQQRNNRNKRKQQKNQLGDLQLTKATSEHLSQSVQSARPAKKLGAITKLKIKRIQEEDCEYTPKNPDSQTNGSLQAAVSWAELEKLMAEWTEDFNKEIKHFIDMDLKGIKLKYIENRESQESRDRLIEYISKTFYANCISVYLLMRARKKSDINSICSLLLDCGIVNSISFPQEKIREVVEEVAASRNLNLRFKRSSFIDMLVKVAFERYYELGEADDPIEVAALLP